MGCSWFTYANSLEITTTGYILIPEYAQNFFGFDKLEVTNSGDYCDFTIVRPDGEEYDTEINGHVLIGLFRQLYNNETPEVSFTDCLYTDTEQMFNNDTVESLRCNTIMFGDNADTTLQPFSLKVVRLEDKNLTYETCPQFSPCGQMGYNDDWSEKEINAEINEWFDYFFK